MGELDLPAMIDYTRKVTNQNKIAYMGHSQGTTEMFLALGLDKKNFWKERISLFIATAPVIMPNRNSRLFRMSSKIENYGEKLLATSKVYELFGFDWSKI